MNCALRRLLPASLLLLALSILTASAFYDPGLQRWINRDLIGEEGGANLYAFARSNPLGSVDPFGLQCPIFQVPPLLLEPPPVTIPPRLMLPPPRPYIPPYGWLPNPARPGGFGRIGPDGKFQELWRFDPGKPGAPGWRGIDHLHLNGQRPHLPIDTPYWFGPGGTLLHNAPRVIAVPESPPLRWRRIPTDRWRDYCPMA